MIKFWLAMSLIWAAWLTFMIQFPDKWNSIVEKENNFWVNKGLLKRSTAEKIARFEKGTGQKLIIGSGILIFLLAAWFEGRGYINF